MGGEQAVLPSFRASGTTLCNIICLSAEIVLSMSHKFSAVLQEQTLRSSSESWHSLQQSGILILAMPIFSISGSKRRRKLHVTQS